MTDSAVAASVDEFSCQRDRQCTSEAGALAIDTSHVCVLARGATQLAADNPPPGDRFRELLGAHSCAGQHRLITSRELMDGELDLTDPEASPRRYADLPVDALDIIEPIDGGTGPDDEEGRVGDRDRTLIGAAQSANETEVIVLTDDEDFFAWTMERLASGSDAEANVYPLRSIDFVGNLHRCRAISFESLSTIADAQEAHVDTYLAPATLRRDSKIRRIQQVIVKAAAIEAGRQGPS